MKIKMKHYKDIIKGYEHLPMEELEAKFNIVHPLGSFFYFSKLKDLKNIHNQFKDKTVNLMVDSGVFTFRKKDMDVDIDTYINYLNAGADYINYAVTLDYPHDAKTIIKNTDYIKERLDPRITLVPVIQTFIFNKEQVEYTLANYEFICLGTYDGKHKSIMYNKEVQDSLQDAYELNKKYKRILHALGRTRVNWLSENPVESSDSSGWARYMFTGNTVLWDNKLKDIQCFRKDEKFRMLKHESYYCKRFNITEDEFYNCIQNPQNILCSSYPHNALCALAYLLIQEEVRKRHSNYRLHMATSNYKNFEVLDVAADLFNNRKH